VARQIAGGHASSTATIGYPPFVGIFVGSGPSSSPQAQAGVAEPGADVGPGVAVDARLGLHQLCLEASSCSAKEVTAPDTERSSHRPRVP